MKIFYLIFNLLIFCVFALYAQKNELLNIKNPSNFENSNLTDNLVITDITQTNLIGDAYNNGLYGGHGVMFCDVDGDGDPDMYITMNNNEEMPDQFFENNGLGVFTEKALEKGIENNDIKGSHGWVWADLDNDGDYDGWNGSYTKNIPYRNKNDQPGYFDDMFSVSGIEEINLGTRGVVAFDFDKDGDLDLFGNNWYARDTKEENEFYINNGNFNFTRIDNGLRNSGGDQGVCDGDFDNDGDIDLILSVFEGNKDGRCVEIMENVEGQFIKLENSGLNLCNASFNGVTFWDMNNDGWLDVITADRILINNKNKTFTEAYQLPEVSNDVMTGIADLNNDGYWDLVSPGLDKVYINNGNLTFTTVTMTTGVINDPRCVSFADIDGDGDVDFALGQKKIYNRLYRNDYVGNNRSLFMKLKTADSQIGAFGAKVYLYSTEGDTLLAYREAHSNQGYLSQDDPTLHFGCGLRDQVKVKVVFLNNSIHEFIVNTNQTIAVNDFYPDLTAPATPINFNAIINLNNVVLSWTKNSEVDLQLYGIYRSIESNFITDTMNSFTYSTSDTFFVDTEIDYGTESYYRIVAVDSAGNKSEASGIISAIIIDSVAPNKPLGLVSALTSENKVILSWDKNLENDIALYRIYRSVENNFNPDTIKTFYTSTNTFFHDINIEEGREYFYRISALDIYGNQSNYSDITSIIISSVNKNLKKPTTFELHQNFPNPFNPTTTITFSVPEVAMINVKVFSLLGQELRTIANNVYNEGTYNIIFNAYELTSGIYLYTITAIGNSGMKYVKSKKLIIMK